MYINNNQINLGQCLADIISKNAQAGAVQNTVWNLAASNQYNNQFFVGLTNTLQSVLQYWQQTGQPKTLEQAVEAVYLCSCGVTFIRNPSLHTQVNQNEGDYFAQWAAYSQKLEIELDQFESQFRQAPVQQSAWDSARYAGNAPGWAAPQQQSGWAQQAAPQQADWAARNTVASNYVAPVSPVAPQPTNNMMSPRQRRHRGPTSPAPATPQFTQPSSPQPPQFTTAPVLNQRSRRNARFNPDDPIHNPVGREVAEQHEAAAAAAGSWESSNFDWDDPTVVFSEPAPKATVSQVKPTETNTPQFLERHSSNKDVGHLIYGENSADGFREFTYEDWVKSPDPEFPWELAYNPRTHTRRIAYDTTRKCYVQLIEENKVNYHDHAIMSESSAARSTLASRKQRGSTPRSFSGDSSKVATLPGLIQERSQIIDGRLDGIRETWEKQEAEAHNNLKEGDNYVAPELTPSREEVIATPLAEETSEQIALASNKLTERHLVTVDLGDSGFINEQHALFAMQAKVAADGFDASDVPAISAKYAELTPFVLTDDNPEEVMDLLEGLTDDSVLKSFVDIAKHMQNIAGDIPVHLWNFINDQLTHYINGVLQTELGLVGSNGLVIDSFAEDAAELPQYIKDNRGEQYLQALSRRMSEFLRPLFCVVNTNLTSGAFETILGNIYPNPSPESDIQALNAVTVNLVDRTVLVRRETTLTRINRTSEELGLMASNPEFTITEATFPELYATLTTVLAATARDDGKAGFFKRVVVLDDGVRFTVHENWMGNKNVLILKR